MGMMRGALVDFRHATVLPRFKKFNTHLDASWSDCWVVGRQVQKRRSY
jgi:hypothetical protein